MDGRDQYKLDGSAPELYQRYLVPAVTALWAADLLARISLRPGERVLDVACGTGIVARGAAEQVGASGHVAAIDVNATMLEVARRLDPPDGAPIAWHQTSALDLPYDEGSFDVVLCQLGLQFFSDQGAALRQMRRVLVARGRLGLSVYSAIEHTPAALALSEALDQRIGGDASRPKRSEHSLADAAELRGLVADAGFGEINITTVSKTLRFGSVADWVHIQLSASPLATLLNGLDPARAEFLANAIVADVQVALAPHSGTGGLAFPQEAHVLLAVA
jgi:ubiquinone/menaquinone biosynthesis C-methylase UbiE